MRPQTCLDFTIDSYREKKRKIYLKKFTDNSYNNKYKLRTYKINKSSNKINNKIIIQSDLKHYMSKYYIQNL